MHIPLDYYRVLGLPIQATAEQLSHAHRDRTLQLPRREFSEWAIAARRQLIDEAYEVLSDPTQRQTYDASFLAKPYDMSLDASSTSSDRMGEFVVGDGESGTLEGEASPGAEQGGTALASPPIPRIEIHDKQFIGALLLLYELGEYELVLKLGRPYLSSGEKTLANGQFGDPHIVGADIVLAIALSCLELGREQWQQGQYEAAAESLETGQELLLREGLFANVRGEVQSDLYKLRPYRILELLALPEERAVERYQGLRLLQDILQDRGGIDGKGNDQSGLGTDDFLRFIQQLRSYLTVAEQQQIFEAEANRPSAVGTYLAVYALIAGGFAHRQPALIQNAKQFLGRLESRQDVNLEKSVCTLLLGQTENANRWVQRSQEKEILAYIRKHSDGSPDLLPGLCLYAEQWLRAEVFPQFRDLNQEDASLKGYFADQSVQSYLENLPTEAEEPAAVANGVSRSSVTTARLNGQESSTYQRRQSRRYEQGESQDRAYGQHARNQAAVGSMVGATAARDGSYGGGQPTTLHPAERVSQLSPEGTLSHPSGQDAGNNGGDYSLQSPQLANVPQGTTITPRMRGSSGPRLDRLLLLAGLGILGVLIMWVVASRIYGWLSRVTRPPLLRGEQLEIQLNQPPIPIPEPTIQGNVSNLVDGELTSEGGESVIRTWLEAKKAAMGPDHDVALLEDILLGEPLARWQGQAVTAQQNDFYLTYDYPNLTVDEVAWSDESPDEATIAVTVTEVGEFYKSGQLDLSQSYDSSISVVYGVVRDEDRWKIQSISTQ